MHREAEYPSTLTAALSPIRTGVEFMMHREIYRLLSSAKLYFVKNLTSTCITRFSGVNMKPLFWMTTVFGYFSFLGTLALAQTKTPSIDIGTVTLNLGMPRDKVFQQIKGAGYSLLEQPPKGGKTTVIVTRDDVGSSEQRPETLTQTQIRTRAVAQVDNDGELTFRAGLLVMIQRKVSATIETDRELVTTLYGLFRQFEAQGSNRPCILHTEEDSSDLVEGKQIEMTCTLPAGLYSSIVVRWVTVETSQSPLRLHVNVFQNLWR